MSVWLVTGGSRGIGRAVVDRVAAAGETVAAFSRSAWTQPPARPDQVLQVKADVTEADSIRHGVETALEAFGAIDVVVNCAGVHRAEDPPGAAVNGSRIPVEAELGVRRGPYRVQTVGSGPGGWAGGSDGRGTGSFRLGVVVAGASQRCCEAKD